MSIQERNKEILRRHIAGEEHPAIGADYGMSRERVRQIVRAQGGVPRRTQIAGRHERIAEYLEQNWVTAQEAAERLGVHHAVIRQVAHKRDIAIPRLDFATEMKWRFLVARVRAGASINSVAISAGECPATLQHHCDKAGVKSRASTRHSDHSHRPEMIRQLREQGLDWRDVGKEIARFENITLKNPAGTIYGWACNNVPELVQPRVRLPKEPKPRRSRPAAPMRAPRESDPVIDVRPSVRETAVANRGHASASQIAAALGVTRNVIIGHWNRHRAAQGAA